MLVVVHGQEDDPAGGISRDQSMTDVQAAVATEAYVEHDDVRPQVAHDPTRLVRIAGLADDPDLPGAAGEHRLEPLEDHFVIVDEHNPQRWVHAQRLVRSTGIPLGFPRRRGPALER